MFEILFLKNYYYMNDFFSDLVATLNDYYTEFVALIPKLGLAVLVFIIAYFIANGIRNLVANRVTPKMDDPLLARFLARTAKTIILVIGILLVLQIIGLGGIASGLLASAGVGAFVIGFAFKDIGENFLAGIMMAFDRPFRIGDTVELNGQKGVVVTLSLRNTQIKTFDGKDIYIPNANVVKNPVVNYTIDGFLRYDFSIGIDYDNDADAAIAMIYKELETIDGILQDTKKPFVSVGSLNSSSMNLDVYFWIDTFDKSISVGKIKTRAINQVLQRLGDEGFYMPGDVLELKNYREKEIKTLSPQGGKDVA